MVIVAWDLVTHSPRLGRFDFQGRCTRLTTEVLLKYRIIIEQDEDGIFVAECSSLPGLVSQGKTRADALANAADAIQGYLASLAKHGEPVPPSISEEIVEVAV